ncbi:MAG: methyltransferase domain-containing protein [Deltaproteobacteria bacterium]|nr:methyltransferase domain-containing protein [Deltaproteobacteria bacterium]MBW2309365.1 methyltransferase domain-containing protein [Deltaproteobacteria bacterium]
MKGKPLLLLFSFLFLGAFSLTAQVLIIREFLVIFYGNELCLGLVFGGWFAGIALGAGIGGFRLRHSGTFDGSDRARSQYTGLMLAAPLVLLAQITAIRAVRGFFGVPPGESIALVPMAAASVVLVAPFSALVGAMFPAACVYLGGQAWGIGRVYVWEAVGSMAGGMLLTFFLLQMVPPFFMVGAFGTVAAALVIVLQPRWPPSRQTAGAFAIISAAMIMAAAGGWSGLEQAASNKRWKDLNPGIDLIESDNSVYQHIDIGFFQKQTSIYGNGQLVSTISDPYRSAPIAHLSLSIHPAPSDVLIMGTTTGELLEEMLLHPVKKLHVVELDDRMLAMVRKYQDERHRKAWNNSRVRVFHDDGRRFIQREGESYDVILVNAPDPSNALLNRLYTREFYQEARRRLKPGGILMTGASLAVNYVGPDVGLYAASIFRTLQLIFSQVVAVPGARAIFIASNGPGTITVDPQELGRRYLQRKIRSEHFSELHFESLLPVDRIEFLQRSIEGVKAYRINTDARPITYFYSMILWELFSAAHSKDTASTLGSLARLDARMVLLALAALAVLRLLSAAPWKRPAPSHEPFNAMLAIAATGMAAMSAEIVLLFSYQNIYGYLYHRVGLVVAAFMLGLALGGWVMCRTLDHLKNRTIALAIMQILVGGYMVSLPPLISLFRMNPSFLWTHGAEAIFMAWVGVAGILTGGVFPLAGSVYLSGRPRPGEAAGWIDALDHLGAFIGATVTGTLFLPLLGTPQTCMIVAAINVLCALMIWLDWTVRPKSPPPAVQPGSNG